MCHKEKIFEWVACSAPVSCRKIGAGAWAIPAIHFADEGASGPAVVEGKSYEHVLYGDYFGLYIEANLNEGSAVATENSSSSGKVKSKKRKSKC